MTASDHRKGVLCLGASVGGLRSLEAVLSRLTPSFPWPILVSQHLHRDHASLMPAILSRSTALEVREATDGEIPVAGVVYTCPSTAELGMSPDGRLTLREPVDGRPQRIDHLFSTSSFARPGHVIAVVLSGTGTDGTAGSLVVKLNGGTVIAESDESAQQSGMPRAAAKAGTVDATRPADAIAPLLVQLAEGGLDEMTKAMERSVGKVAETLTASSGTDFTRYRLATLRRRIEKRRALVGLPDVEAYHELVRRDEDERLALTKSLLLPVTEFFRDPPAWEALSSEVLVDLAERARSGATVRVWCAGCASGEEVYSMAIGLAEAGAPLERVEIVGTDLDPDSIRLADAGVFDAARMANVTAARRARFFAQEDGAYRVVPPLRSAASFRVHDLTRDPAPPGAFDIVVCRNVLIYFDESLQAQALASFEGCMTPGGVLFLGRSTALLASNDAFEPIARTMRIFRSRRPGAPPPTKPRPQAASPTRVDARADDPRAIDAVLVEDSDAIMLIVDASWKVAVANRRARTVASRVMVGENLLDVFPRWQGSPVHDALRATMSTGRSVRIQGVPMGGGFVDLTLEALQESDERKLVLVAHPSEPRAVPAHRPHDDQQLLREDLAATNDELQTANEELAAANEELQATNEELASLNEEFLSTNQNLASTNAEMHANALHSPAAAELLHAILAARGEAAITCDAARRVTFVTPHARSLLGLGPNVVGKPLERALDIAGPTLEEWLRASAQGAPPHRRDVATPDGRRDLTVELLAGADGAKLGWLLTWCAPEPARLQRLDG